MMAYRICSGKSIKAKSARCSLRKPRSNSANDVTLSETAKPNLHMNSTKVKSRMSGVAHTRWSTHRNDARDRETHTYWGA